MAGAEADQGLDGGLQLNDVDGGSDLAQHRMLVGRRRERRGGRTGGGKQECSGYGSQNEVHGDGIGGNAPSCRGAAAVLKPARSPL